MRRLGVDRSLVQSGVPDVDEGHAHLGRPGLDAVLRRPEIDQQLALPRRQDAIALVGDLALAEPHARDDARRAAGPCARRSRSSARWATGA